MIRSMVGLILMALVITFPEFAFSEIKVIDVAFATYIQNRKPVNIFSPPGHCANNTDEESLSVPVIDSKMYRRVYFWNKISSSSPLITLLHTWHKDGVAFQIKRTKYSSIDKIMSYIERIKVGIGWKKVASVELTVKNSPRWRTWSQKEIDPIVHVGKWKVVVSTAGTPNDILCEAHFEIR